MSTLRIFLLGIWCLPARMVCGQVFNASALVNQGFGAATDKMFGQVMAGQARSATSGGTITGYMNQQSLADIQAIYDSQDQPSLQTSEKGHAFVTFSGISLITSYLSANYVMLNQASSAPGSLGNNWPWYITTQDYKGSTIYIKAVGATLDAIAAGSAEDKAQARQLLKEMGKGGIEYTPSFSPYSFFNWYYIGGFGGASVLSK